MRIRLNVRITELRFFRAFCVNLVLFFPCELLRHIHFITLNPRHDKAFYLQLYTVDLGIKTSLALYTVSASGEFHVRCDHSLTLRQVTILNAGGIFGRLLPNFLADHFGPYNMLIICLFICSTLAFAMLSISNFGGVTSFALFYGFWSGSCKLFRSFNTKFH